MQTKVVPASRVTLGDMLLVGGQVYREVVGMFDEGNNLYTIETRTLDGWHSKLYNGSEKVTIKHESSGSGLTMFLNNVKE